MAELNETGVHLLATLAAEHLTGADVLYWTCEYCGATPGVPCRARVGTGRVLSSLEAHKSRREQCGRWQRWHIDYPGAAEAFNAVATSD